MAGLFLKLGPVQSAKTMIALSTVYNYKDRNQKVLLARPKRKIDLEPVVESHVGLSADCIYIEQLINMNDIDLKGYDCIVIDDCHDLTESQVQRLIYITDFLNIPVVCYGLKTNYLGVLFEGTRKLLEEADKVEEIKAVCWCGHKATHNIALTEDGDVIRNKTTFDSCENPKFIALCRKHFYEGKLN